ncbi:glycosyltransferase family 9 protein [Paraferrimonas sedimenticola]|uniref:Heptosyltransferase n=1 Tax=Paraferrimonas sedimenticola TaxID=375674 RepID=A0AA37RWS7_9GAMM|nr:glycosyltransferase family 9 protein [Paraferrimonas sedimenticola]GLP96359.1 heptosyltransferase [Paraferrimonas sedimenticola]
MNALLVKLTSNQVSVEKIPSEEIQKILIVRINYRIGNIIFLTPLINALRAKFPEAQIDVLIGTKLLIPVLKPMHNVTNVYQVPRKILKEPGELIRQVKEINQNNYDLAISPIAGSSSANISTMMIKAKYKLSFHSEGAYTPANIKVPYPEGVHHEALIPLALMDGFDGPHQEYKRTLDINLHPEEAAQGQETLFSLLHKSERSTDVEGKVFVGLFRDARNEKKIEDSWWKAFIDDLAKGDSLIIVDILAPGQSESVHPAALAIGIADLRELSSFMSSLDYFICADTGPMHLASAVQTTVIALFNATSPDNYGPLGANDSVVNISNKTISDVAVEVQGKIQKSDTVKELK